MEGELREMGFSDNEVIVYLTLIKTGVTTANRISLIAGVKKSTTYDVLGALISKGIVSTSKRNNVQHFTAAEPSKLLYVLDEKRRKIEKIIPDLEKLQEVSKEKGGVTYFEGKKGVVTVLNDLLDDGAKELMFIGSRKMAKIPLRHYPDNFVVRRVDRGIRVSGLLAQEDRDDEFSLKQEVKKLSKFKYKKELDNSTCDLFIYNDKVGFITNVEDPIGVIVNNREIADQMKRLFKMLK